MNGKKAIGCAVVRHVSDRFELGVIFPGAPSPSKDARRRVAVFPYQLCVSCGRAREQLERERERELQVERKTTERMCNKTKKKPLGG